MPNSHQCSFEDFVASLAPTHKHSTCKHYRNVLRAFHAWLDKHQLCLSQLQRDHMTRWFAHLNDRRLHPATRGQRIVIVKSYLRWLDAHGVLCSHPDKLIRRADLPKRPEYLPRPLPPQADRELQRRLADSADLYQQGLLLMRRTGIRIGELAALERNCIRTDSNDHRFLKVPLGKLDNERLVPIDRSTFELVERLQHNGCPDRQWLLVTPIGTNTRHVEYNRILRQVCHDLDIPDRLTTHRLRHTYATTLLNAGMSVVAVMRLLGHRSIKMTLRYAAITQQTVQREYFEAIARIEQRYSQALPPSIPPSDPQHMLSDIGRWITKSFAQTHPRQVQALLKRIKRLQAAVLVLAAH
jgi:site-specific recombinase XerD